MTGAGDGVGGSWLALLFILLALPNGLFLAGAIPLGQVADELSHVLRADAVAGGELCGVRRLEPAPDGAPHPAQGVIARFEFIGAVASPVAPADRAPQLVNRAELDASRALRFAGGTRFNVIGSIAGYFPVFYLPGALAIELARSVDAGPVASWYAVRVANLLGAVSLGALAVAIARRGRLLIVATLLLPGALSLAASANEDGLIIAAAALAVAAATRLPDARPTRSPFFWLLAALLGCICLAKLPYGGLLVLLFGAPRCGGARPGRGRSEMGAENGRRLGVAAAIGLAAVAWAAYSQHRSGAPLFRPPAEAGPLWPGARPAVFGHTDVGAQLRVLLARPRRLLTLPLRTIAARHALFGEAVGLLGWLNFAVPRPVRLAWVATLAAAWAGPFVLGRGGVEWPGALQVLLLLAGLLLSVDLIYLALYLTWTPVGAPFVDGVQGRYLLPLLPALALLLPTRTRPPPVGGVALLAALPLAASLLTAFSLPRAVARFYYFG